MKKILTLTMVAVMLAACGTKEITVETPKTVNAEYGEELNNKLLFDEKKSDKNVEVKKVDGFNKSKLGEQKVKVTFSDGKEEVVKEIKINVIRTKWFIIGHRDYPFRLGWRSFHHPIQGNDAPVFTLVQQGCLPAFHNVI